jgi:hypothetical protein
MASDYNADLIASLYSTSDAEEAARISSEMASIGDAIFPRQIYEAYKRFKNTFVSHYFVSDLTSFSTSDADEILKEIARTTQRSADISLMLEYLTEVEFFEPSVVEHVRSIFDHYISEGDLEEYDVEKYFNYLKKSGYDIEKLERYLITCFEDDRHDISSRKLALRKLLKLNAKKHIKYYYDNYTNLKSNKRAEVIFVEEISTWHGGIIPAVHDTILNSGSERAKEILREVQRKKAEESLAKEVTEQIELKAEYETADVIADISSLRSQINKLSLTDDRFGFQLLSTSEEIYQQSRSAKDKATMLGYCMVLRTLLGGFPQEVLNYSINSDRAAELNPDIKDLQGSINKFHLLLLDKAIEVDSNIFGLRNINRIITKFAAHTGEENSPELTELLKKEGLFEIYKDDNWSKFHREILMKYKGFLEKLVKAINKN